MNTLYILCEGQSEETFINKVLAPYFQSSNLHIIPIITKTSANAKGGGLKYSRIRKEILNLLNRKQAFVSTFFDYYALPYFSCDKSSSCYKLGFEWLFKCSAFLLPLAFLKLGLNLLFFGKQTRQIHAARILCIKDIDENQA